MVIFGPPKKKWENPTSTWLAPRDIGGSKPEAEARVDPMRVCREPLKPQVRPLFWEGVLTGWPFKNRGHEVIGGL